MCVCVQIPLLYKDTSLWIRAHPRAGGLTLTSFHVQRPSFQTPFSEVDIISENTVRTGAVEQAGRLDGVLHEVRDHAG